MSAVERVRGVIFDLDGTLIDTLDDITDALNRVLAARGLPTHTRQACRRLIGGGAANLARRALPAHALELAPALLDDFRRDYSTSFCVKSAPYPGVPALLAALAARGVQMCVLSNKPDAPTRALIGALFPTTQWVDVVGERPGRARKPDPGVALELAARMQLAPGCCALVGDSDFDIRAARAAGMRAVGVSWGFRDADELLAEGAELLIERAEQLLHLV